VIPVVSKKNLESSRQSTHCALVRAIRSNKWELDPCLTVIWLRSHPTIGASTSRCETVRLLSNDYQTTYVLHPPRGRVEGEERAFGEGWRDNPRIPSVSALPALARLGSLRDPPKGRVNLSCTTSRGRVTREVITARPSGRDDCNSSNDAYAVKLPSSMLKECMLCVDCSICLMACTFSCVTLSMF
jgi:hypothetical protein